MTDAAEIKPKLIPDDVLRARDNSGGLGFLPHTGDWGDGGYVFGSAKPHLSGGGKGPGAGKATNNEDDHANEGGARSETRRKGSMSDADGDD